METLTAIIERIQLEKGWSDATLLIVLMDMLEDECGVDEVAIEKYLESC